MGLWLTPKSAITCVIGEGLLPLDCLEAFGEVMLWWQLGAKGCSPLPAHSKSDLSMVAVCLWGSVAWCYPFCCELPSAPLLPAGYLMKECRCYLVPHFSHSEDFLVGTGCPGSVPERCWCGAGRISSAPWQGTACPRGGTGTMRRGWEFPAGLILRDRSVGTVWGCPEAGIVYCEASLFHLVPFG